MSRETKEIYEFGPFRLDVGEHIFECLDGGESVYLPEKAFQTLVALVRNYGRLVEKDELLSVVWPDTIVEENNLDKAIHVIRQALKQRSGGQSYIETVRKHGYRFVAPVRSIDPFGVDAAKAEEPRTGPASNGVPYPDQPAGSEHNASEAKGGDAAVSNGFKANGTGNIADLRAEFESHPIADTVSTQAKETESTPALIAPERTSKALGLTAAAVGVVALLAMGGWVAKSGWLPADVPVPSSSVNSKNSASDLVRSPAYDLYVRGKVKVASENRADTVDAIKLLEEAIALDSNFAEAYAQLARGYNTLAFKYSSDADRKRNHENAEVAIEKALILNPDLAEGHFARGLILWTNSEGFPHEQAIRSYKRSLELDPTLDETHHQLSMVYSHIGLLEEADRSVKNALEINPNNTLARFRAGVYVAYQGRFDEAISIYKTIPRETTPLLVERSMAEALIQTGRTAEAAEIADGYLQANPQDDGGSFTSVKALLLAKAGKHQEAEEAIARAVEIGNSYGHFHHSAYNVASAYAAMGKPAEAVKWLKVTADTGFPNYTYFEKDPNLDAIRQDPQFLEFMRGLRAQWERYKSLG